MTAGGKCFLGYAETMTIRPFMPADYEALTLLGNLNFPDHQDTVDEIKWGDMHRDPKHQWARFVGVENGEIVAIGDYGQNGGMFHPRKFGVMVMVHPEKQGCGFGKAMYAHVLQAIEPFAPLSVRAFARENMPRPVRFLLDRGFREDMRYFESSLEVRAFDFAPFTGAEEKAAQNGIIVKTLAELMETDPNWKRKFYELTQAVKRDIPRPEPWTPTEFEVWEQQFENPDWLPDANFVALDGSKYVGISTIYKKQADFDLHTGITGTLSDYRRKGIALALKLQAVRYAKNAGTPAIRTGNETGNLAMLAINEAMGFVKQTAWISFVKVLRTEENGE